MGRITEALVPAGFSLTLCAAMSLSIYKDYKQLQNLKLTKIVLLSEAKNLVFLNT